MPKLQRESNGSPAEEVFSGRIGPDTRYELTINGPLDGSILERLIESLKSTRQALGHSAVAAAGAK